MNSLLRRAPKKPKRKEPYFPKIGDTIYAERIREVKESNCISYEMPYGEMIPTMIKEWKGSRNFKFFGYRDKFKPGKHLGSEMYAYRMNTGTEYFYQNYFLLPIRKVNARMLLTEKL